MFGRQLVNRWKAGSFLPLDEVDVDAEGRTGATVVCTVALRPRVLSVLRDGWVWVWGGH
jgi:hypothetical protein